ncbi:MAG: hypothetical protein ACPGGJ_02745, partial [Coraliomargarita sp.]
LPAELGIGFFLDAASSQIRGGRIHDFHIGRIASEQGAASLVTENKKHFLSVAASGMNVMTANEYLQSTQNH